MDEDDFRKQLRTASRPTSPVAWYVAAAAVSILGIVTVIGAESRQMFISGWIMIGGSLLAALWTRRTSWRR